MWQWLHLSRCLVWRCRRAENTIEHLFADSVRSVVCLATLKRIIESFESDSNHITSPILPRFPCRSARKCQLSHSVAPDYSRSSPHCYWCHWHWQSHSQNIISRVWSPPRLCTYLVIFTHKMSFFPLLSQSTIPFEEKIYFNLQISNNESYFLECTSTHSLLRVQHPNIPNISLAYLGGNFFGIPARFTSPFPPLDSCASILLFPSFLLLSRSISLFFINTPHTLNSSNQPPHFNYRRLLPKNIITFAYLYQPVTLN